MLGTLLTTREETYHAYWIARLRHPPVTSSTKRWFFSLRERVQGRARK
jgi:hypothetical protein